mgnify:FL=1
MMRDDSFWKEYRPTELTKSEDNMGQFVDNLAKIKGFKYIIFVAKALSKTLSKQE